MTLVGKQFWAQKQGKELADEITLKARRYFEACERMNLIARWRQQYRIYFMRDPYGKSGMLEDSSMLTLGTKAKPEIAIQVPEVRALLRQQLAFIMAEPVTFQCVASTGAQRNVMSSEVGEKALNYVYNEHCKPSVREFAEQAIVYGMSSTHLRWNESGGDDVTQKVPLIDPTTGQPPIDPNTGMPAVDQKGQPLTHDMVSKSGAPYVDVCDPSMMAMDPRIGVKAGWIIAFEQTNLFVLAAQHPEMAEQILAQPTKDEFEMYRLCPGMWTEMYGANEGDIIVMHFYYADKPELPGGRYALVVGDLVVTKPDEKCPLQAGRLPVRPLVTAKYTDNALSFADSFGVGPIEEALNRTRSSELNNYAYYGKQTRWREETTRVIPGDDANTRELVGPRASQPPQMLAIQPMPSGAETLKKDLLEALPRVSGFSDVSRGMKIEQTTSGAHAQVFEAITARNLSLSQNDMKQHEQELANDMLAMLQTFGNTAFIAEIAGPDGAAIAREFSPQDLSTLRRLVAKAVPEGMRGSMARLQLVEATQAIEDPSERAKAIQMVLRGDDEYGRNDSRVQNLIAIENERLISGSEPVTVAITQNHMLHMPDHQAALDYLLSQENPDAQAVVRLTQHIMEHAQKLQDADPVVCKALGYPDPPILPGNAAFVFAQRMAQAQMMLQPQETPDPITGMVPNSNPNPNDQQAQQAAQQAPTQSGPPQAAA
jgi:hypothetical protein